MDRGEEGNASRNQNRTAKKRQKLKSKPEGGYL
jgi:hypothetical protein